MQSEMHVDLHMKHLIFVWYSTNWNLLYRSQHPSPKCKISQKPVNTDMAKVKVATVIL
jgi:hypothetical protein